MLDFHRNFWAIAHDHSCTHIQMENESNTDQCSPTVDYPKIDGMHVQLDVAHGMCSKAANF